MNKSAYSQGKRQREQDKARKKRDKAKRQEQRRDQGSAGFEIVSVEDVVGRLPTSTEAMLAIHERAKAPRSAGTVPCRLFVGGLSWDTTEEALHKLFSQIGTVSEAAIPTDRNSGQSRGFGFVTFEDRKDGALAIEQLNGYELDGRKIVVNVATKR
jgi:hypothetical protein